MQKIKEQLKKIAEVWNHYVLDLRYFHEQVNFTADVQTNYFGDILRYFEETFDLLKVRKTKGYPNHIFNMIGLLQVIYIQQDLTDELLSIFNLERSLLKEKNPNREIRNELIGHPISRKNDPGKTLISSVFFGFDLSPEYIRYIRYSRENNFKGKVIEKPTKDIIAGHQVFLEKFFSRIIDKLDKMLLSYRQELEQIQDMIAKKAAFPEIVIDIDQRFEKVLKNNYLYEKEILLKLHNRRHDHPRYEFVTRYFIAEMNIYLKDSIGNIDELLQRSYAAKRRRRFKTSEINIVFVSANDPANAALLEREREPRSSMHYELSKLHERSHPIFGVDFFTERFKNNPEITIELVNMRDNINNIPEYYCSFEYLKFLISGKTEAEYIKTL